MPRHPYPYIATILPDGTVKADDLDSDRRIECVRDHLCQVCGEPLDATSFALPKDGVASGAQGLNGDALLHGRCLLAAARECAGENGLKTWLRTGKVHVVRCQGRYALRDPDVHRVEVDLSSMMTEVLVSVGARPEPGVPVDVWLVSHGVS